MLTKAKYYLEVLVTYLATPISNMGIYIVNKRIKEFDPTSYVVSVPHATDPRLCMIRVYLNPETFWTNAHATGKLKRANSTVKLLKILFPDEDFTDYTNY